MIAITCRVTSRPGNRQARKTGGRREQSAHDDRKPDVQVHFTLGAAPRPRAQAHRRDNSAQPLQHHQGGKQPVRAAEDPLPFLVKNPLSVGGNRRVKIGIHHKTSRTEEGPVGIEPVASRREQPKMSVSRTAGRSPRRIASTAKRPALSPS